MMAKLLFVLFSNPQTAEFFYTNDLVILIDIVIRYIRDLDREDEVVILTFIIMSNSIIQLTNPTFKLRQSLLRVLLPTIQNTTYLDNTSDPERIPKLLREIVNDTFDPHPTTVTIAKTIYDQCFA
jgi:hypothetical protein